MIKELSIQFEFDVPGWRFNFESLPLNNGDPYWAWNFMCFSGAVYWRTDRPDPVFTKEDADAAKKWADEAAEKITWE